jgi:signal transduction histidine kinase
MDASTSRSAGVLQNVVDDVLSALAMALGARRAAALILDEDGQSCRAIASWGLTDAERDRVNRWLTIGDDSQPYWTRLAEEAAPVYLAGAPGEAKAPWQGGLEVLPHLAVPLLGTAGRLLGVILLDTPAAPGDEHRLVAAKMGRVAAVAIEQTRTADGRAVELARNAVLLDIVREVDRRVELPEVLAAICRKTVEGFGSRQTTVYFYSRRHRASLPLADYGTPPHVVERFVGGRYNRGNIPREDEVAEGRTAVITRSGEPPAEDVALLDMIELYALVMVPLRDDGGTVRGMLTVGFADERDFTAEEMRAFEMVGHHAAMAIMRARFLHRTAESAHFRAAVSALAVELNAAHSRAATLHVVTARGCELFGVDTATLLLAAGNRLVATATHGDLLTADPPVISLDGPESSIIQAFRTGEVVLENDRARRDDGEPIDRLRSLLAIPLVESDGQIGVLVFGALRPRLFRPTVVEEAPVLGALTAAVLRSLELMGRLHETNERLGRVSALKDQFLANVSHDLRTPLNVIIGFAQLALEDTFGAPTPELREILERMLASARQQLTLVQDLLDVSRLELNGLSVKPTAVALRPLFADMEFLTTSLLRHKPVRFAVEAPAADTWVQADADRLRQVLTNLLANAAKFTDEGTIGLRAVAAREGIRIEVSDTGIGIAPEEVAAVFEPFRQVDSDRAVLGTGLGLAIAQRLAHLMAGTLTLESTLGRGSTFTLTLPAVGSDLGDTAPSRIEIAASA